VGRFKGILAIRTLERDLGVLRTLLFKANFERHAVGQMSVIIFVHMSIGIRVQQCCCRRLGPYCAVWNLPSPPKKGNTPPII